MSGNQPLPDLKYINRKIPILEIALALDLRLGSNGNLHCWHPDRHQNGDRTASVGICKTTNTLKCFGCGLGPLGVVDLVSEVLGFENPREAGEWVASRFSVPTVPSGKHIVQPERRIFRVGFESDIGLLVRSGLWARLSAPARAIVPVLLELANRDPKTQTLRIQISYVGLQRYSGIASPNTISRALKELEDVHWLTILSGTREAGSGPVRGTSSYLITPRSDELLELAHSNSAKMRDEIDAQRKVREEGRNRRRRGYY